MTASKFDHRSKAVSHRRAGGYEHERSRPHCGRGPLGTSNCTSVNTSASTSASTSATINGGGSGVGIGALAAAFARTLCSRRRQWRRC